VENEEKTSKQYVMVYLPIAAKNSAREPCPCRFGADGAFGGRAADGALGAIATVGAGTEVDGDEAEEIG
jgi:hypothetical protein